jgi:hypothetical protein
MGVSLSLGEDQRLKIVFSWPEKETLCPYSPAPGMNSAFSISGEWNLKAQAVLLIKAR